METNNLTPIKSNQVESEDFFDSPIFITGVPRSGTSLIAGLLHISGAWKGETVGPSKENAKGFFENMIMRETVLKPYIRSINCDPIGQNKLPSTSDCIIDLSIKNKIKRVLLDQGYYRGRWMYKDAKLLLTWPLWTALYPKANWIFVRRNISSIALSCMNTNFMRVCKTREDWMGWIEGYAGRKLELQETIGDDTYYEFDVDTIIKDPATIKHQVQQLGLTWDTDRAKNFINKTLWHF